MAVLENVVTVVVVVVLEGVVAVECVNVFAVFDKIVLDAVVVVADIIAVVVDSVAVAAISDSAVAIYDSIVVDNVLMFFLC